MDEVLRMSEAIASFGLGVVRNNIDSGRWQRPRRGVVALHNGPLTPLQRDLVLLASVPHGSVLGGLAALHHEGFDDFATAPTLVLPSGARRPPDADAEIRWSTELGEQDVHPLRTPRRTRPARSLVDAASWCRSDRQARAIVIAGIQHGLADTRHLREALSRRGPCRRRALIVESILDAAGGIQSLPERDFDHIRAVAGLPPPTRQQQRRGKDGRYYLDATWDELEMSVEIHGIPHLAVSHWDADLLRANEVVISGDRLLAFSSYAVRHEEAVVADQLLRMARSRGWHGGPTDLSAFRQLGQRKSRKFRPYAG